MSTIAEKLVLVNRTKTDIKAAIEEKGQTVGGMAFSQYANRVRAIKGLSPVTPSSASTADVTGKLNCLNGTKANIKTAIEACGVPVGSIPFSQYADKIRAIQIEPTVHYLNQLRNISWSPEPYVYPSEEYTDNDTKVSAWFDLSSDEQETILQFNFGIRQLITENGNTTSSNLSSGDFTTSVEVEDSDGIDTYHPVPTSFVEFRVLHEYSICHWRGTIVLTPNKGNCCYIEIEINYS